MLTTPPPGKGIMFSLVHPRQQKNPEVLRGGYYNLNFISENFVEIFFSLGRSTNLVSSLFLSAHKAQDIYHLPFIIRKGLPAPGLEKRAREQTIFLSLFQ